MDPGAHTVGSRRRPTVRYDKLLLATGSGSRRPPILAPMPPASTICATVDDAVA